MSGTDVYQDLKFENGTHRIQRVPATEKQGRVHTSTAAVLVMPQPREVDAEVSLKDVVIETMRASGAGGQHVNTTDSAVRATHTPTGIVVTSAVSPLLLFTLITCIMCTPELGGIPHSRYTTVYQCACRVSDRNTRIVRKRCKSWLQGWQTTKGVIRLLHRTVKQSLMTSACTRCVIFQQGALNIAALMHTHDGGARTERMAAKSAPVLQRQSGSGAQRAAPFIVRERGPFGEDTDVQLSGEPCD